MIFCFRFNKLYINFLSIIISIVLISSIFKVYHLLKNQIIYKIANKDFAQISSVLISKDDSKNYDNLARNELDIGKLNNDLENEKVFEEGKTKIHSNENAYNNEFEWALRIPSINLYAQIEEGTTDIILNRSIGHFEESERRIGNVCLAAHNRGYKVNYFSKLKNLSIGDKIYYTIDGSEKEYEVFEMLVISETDWKMLENTKDNRLTLITCIENREEYRLCVQAIEI